jgi:fluoroquinolone transport system permease protein
MTAQPTPAPTSLIRAFRTFGRHDLRTLGRESLLVMVAVGPFLYAVALWFLPAATDLVRDQWSIDIGPYRSAIISAFCILGPPLLLGAVLALQLLDERDQHTLTALRVTPIPTLTYPTYRAVTITAATTISVLASLALTGQVPLATLALSIPVALIAGLLAPVLGLLMAAAGRTKIEGLAMMRVIGLAVFTLPIIPFFLQHTPWQLAFGVLPAYWPVRAFWSAYDGGTYWPYVLGGLAYNLALVILLLRVVSRRLAGA